MKPEDFDLYATMLKQRSGFVLTPDKTYLLEARLLPVTRKWNLKSLDDLAQIVRSKRDEAMLSDITEAMVANESSFFQDKAAFMSFRNVALPKLLAARASKKHIRIWSAACSSGQEAYSLALICAEEADKLQGWKVEIIGTDLSREMITRAKAGIYSQFEVQRGLPIKWFVKYFQKNGDKWQIKENIRQMVQFREGNLLHDLGSIGVMDVVFCRDVLSGFEATTRSKVLNAVGQIVAPDGYLYIGHQENIDDLSSKFKPYPNEEGLYRVG